MRLEMARSEMLLAGRTESIARIAAGHDFSTCRWVASAAPPPSIVCHQANYKKAALFASPPRLPHRRQICVPASLEPTLQQRLRTAAKLDRCGVVRGIDNVGVSATDLPRSIAFYETLGFSEAYRNDRCVMKAAGTGQLSLAPAHRSEAKPVGREFRPLRQSAGHRPHQSRRRRCGCTLQRAGQHRGRVRWSA
jgi:hypothetical protein